MERFLFAIILFVSFTLSNGQVCNPQQALNQFDRNFFIENKGQWHDDVLYLCRMQGLDIWITTYGTNYTFYTPQEISDTNLDYTKRKNVFFSGHRILLKYKNHNPSPSKEGRQKLSAYYNYFIGNNPSRHASSIALYKEVVVKDVYKGIDIRYYFDQGRLRYDYIIHPGANPNQIEFTLEGHYGAFTKESYFYFLTRFGQVTIGDLYAYQGDYSIPVRFEQQDHSWKIQVDEYDATKKLIIDPLVYSTFIGGSSFDFGYAIAIDGNGNAYITGESKSSDYDTTAGVFQTTIDGNYDIIVTKLDATGSTLIYSTFIGGMGSEFGYGIAVDGSGNVYITGETTSLDFDTTAGAFQTTQQGFSDAFVVKLNSTGTALLYSTLLGGGSEDRGNAITIDNNGNAYITGETKSIDFPTSADAFQKTYEGNSDVFVTKLNSTGSGFIYSTYIGGIDEDRGLGIAIDGTGNAYITGTTRSNNYDTTVGAYQTARQGYRDAFITKLNAAGDSLIYSTYLGGNGYEYGNGIVIDEDGNAYITGETSSTDFDTTAGAYQTTFGSGSTDAFITKLNSTGNGLIYSTYLGGFNTDTGYGIALDGNRNAYITGFTTSSNFDTTAGAYQTVREGGNEIFITIIDAYGANLHYSTYLGGSDDDYGYSIATDGIGSIYITGYTESPSFDITSGAYQTSISGWYDVFVTKLFVDNLVTNDVIQNQFFSFQIIPNPSDGNFVIYSEKPAEFELLDIAGRVLDTYQIGKKRYEVQANLPAGIYFIREKTSRTTQKLLIY